MRDHPHNCASFAGEEVSGNIYIRKVRLEKEGDFVDGHQHNFDHTSIFWRGSFRVETKAPDGTKSTHEIVAPAYLLIKAEVEHLITLTKAAEGDPAGAFWCVYSHRNANGEVVQEPNGYTKAYE